MPNHSPIVDQQKAIDLLHGLVSIRSLSRQEGEATAWLAEQMNALGYDRAYVDDAGNAVGEFGSADASQVIVLLGHIDTVPGDVPIRIVKGEGGDQLLYGRGSVDAKGPLATFTAAVANLGSFLSEYLDFRVVVVGAVEEEAATSKGARFIRDRFNGKDEPIPLACIIGEPSNWRRVTMGYKGRLLLDMEAWQPMAHTAGPSPGVATIAVDLWNRIWSYAQHFNEAQPKLFDQLMPSLRRMNTTTDEQMMDRISMQVGIRLPLSFDADGFAQQIVEWVGEGIDGQVPSLPSAADDSAQVELVGDSANARLHFHGHEAAWRGGRNNALVRSFTAAIRQADPSVRPGLVSKTGTSDMNVVGPAWQCPIVAYGPGDNALDHTPNEHISLSEYWRAIQILEQALRNLISSQNPTSYSL